ncbi:MAG TPA: hypothetical protein VK742_02870 [Candidatus Sulfotelmatobacter sp.]|jgi:hypothetical protein|nr:hypothetical protein [Candidatus Sulfotelmatobacter sp.]
MKVIGYIVELLNGCEQFFGDALSLTLTLSRWERGQLLDGFVKFVSYTAEFSRGHAERLGAFLPLRAGEGRGEGEYRVRQDGYDFLKTL